VSLGYFQAERLRRSYPRLAGLPFVRRPSGGAALVHHLEVTYGLGLPAGPPWQTGESWLCRMHGILTRALDRLGVAAAACGPAGRERFSGFLCFQHLTPGDLLIGPAKVAGSAQRRHRGALMQHGAVLLSASPYAPELPGIYDLGGPNLSVEKTCRAVAESFARTTGLDLVRGGWAPEEERLIGELARTKYSQPAWNAKR
jgi:lipoate-protein ligase A